MSVENINPGSLEGYEDFESMAFSLRTELEEELDRLVETGQSLMDEDFEAKSLTLLKLTDSLGRLFFNDFDTDTNDAVATAHRAFYFGLLIGRQLNPGKRWGFDLSELQQFSDWQEMEAFIQNRADSYLQYRPVIDNLISRYMMIISPNPQLEAGAETIAAFAVAQVEREHFDGFIDEQAVIGAFDEVDEMLHD